MKYNKQALSISNQVVQLKKRGLKFNDDAFAKKVLSRISYYRLRAYTFPFQDNTNPEHPFITEIDFETIISLYSFDAKLRVLVFEAIEKIEIALRTQIIYQFSMTHGSHWQTDPTLYRDVARFASHLDTLNKEIDRSDETFISHYNDTYTSPSQPPSWMSLEVASMGTLSKIYQNLRKSDEKERVAKYFGLPNVNVMENWMFCFSTLRNICAHHGRLWNRRVTSQPTLPYNTTNTFFKKEEINTVYPNKLYATLCCMRYMLREIDAEYEFHTNVKSLMDDCVFNQEKEMGFIENWKSHPIWI